MTPLCWAMAGKGAARDFDPRTRSVRRRNREAVMKMLREAGADPDVRTGTGNTLLVATSPTAAALRALSAKRGEQ